MVPSEISQDPMESSQKQIEMFTLRATCISNFPYFINNLISTMNVRRPFPPNLEIGMPA